MGDGRALVARAAGDRLVVATTIGVSVLDGDAPAVVLAEGLPGALAVSPDGRRAAFTSGGRLEVWDLTALTEVAGYDIAPDQYASLAFATSDVVVAAGAGDVTAYAADGGAGRGPTPIVEAPAGGVLGPPAVAPTGAVAVPVASGAPAVVVWTAGAPVRTVDLGAETGTELIGVAWSSDGSHFAVLAQPPAQSESVGIWDAATGTSTGTVAIPNFVTPQQLAFIGPDRLALPLPDRLAAIGLDGAEVASTPVTSGEVAVQLGLTSAAVVIGGYDGRLRQWDGAAAPVELAPSRFNLVDVSVATGTDDVLAVDHFGTIVRYRSDGAVEPDERFAAGEVNGVAVTSDGSRIATAGSTGAVQVLDARAGVSELALARPEGSVASVAFSPDGPLLASGLGVQIRDQVWNDAVTLTDLDDGATLAGFGGEQENVAGCSFFLGEVAFSPDGTLLAGASHDYTVEVVPVAGGEPAVLGPHDGTILDLAFSPDGAMLATSSEDGTLRIWDVVTMTQSAQHEAPPGGWWSLAFAPDGSTLAASDVEGAISLVDVTTGDTTRTFTGAKAQRGDMALSPDGALLVAGSPDGGVDVWSVASGAVVDRLNGPTLAVTDVVVSADGSTVVASSMDGTVRTWPLPA